MHRKINSSKELLDKIYLTIGKIVVFTGAFCGLLFVLSSVIDFVEPFIVSAIGFCLINIKWLLISVFLLVFAVWGIFRLFEIYTFKKKTKLLESSK